MAIEDYSVYEDLLKLADGPEYGTSKKFECTLIIDDYQLRAMSVNNYSYNRDYKESYSDSSIIEVLIPMGTYMSKIYPLRQKLMVKLKTTVVGKHGEEIDIDKGTSVQLFRATIVDSRDPSILDVNDESENINLGDTSTLMTIELQLTDIVLEAIRQIGFQSIVRDSDLESVIKCLLRGDSFIGDDIIKPLGVLMAPSDNTKVYKQIIFSPDLNLIEIPDWLQNNYGVYNNGLGVYLQKGFWFVFPLFQTEKFKEDDSSVTIVSMPPSKMTGSEKTFSFKDKHLVILATGDRDHFDNTDAMQRNIGNGYRYINGDKVIDDYSKVLDGNIVVPKKENIIEFKSINRADGKNYIPFLKDIATVNHPKVLSKIAKASSNTLTINWENSLPDLLIPGMRVRYLYRENYEVKTITGVLINVLQTYSAINEGLLQDTHSSMSILTILMQS